MVRIKICGLMDLTDISYVNQLQPEYAGFVFAKGRHQLSISQVSSLTKELKGIKSVGVFVSESVADILYAAKRCHLDVIQLHGDYSQSDIHIVKANSSCEIWKAIRIRKKQDLMLREQLQCDRFLLDSYHEQVYGGSGKRINVSLHGENLENDWLAGGITCDTIQDVLTYHPYGIDISSGVETNGRKDYNKIKKIIEEVRI